MNKFDLMNGVFEAVAAVLVWGNVRKLLRDKQVRGVNLQVNMWYVVWGCSSLTYYYHLGHWVSFLGNCGILTANIVWLALALRYRSR